MSSCQDSPSFSVTGTLTYCSPHGSFPLPLSLTITDVTENAYVSPSITAGASKVVAPGTTPASFVYIRSPQQIIIRVNGGTEDQIVDRLYLWTGPVSSVEIFNTVASPAKDVQVDVWFVTGTLL